MKREETLLNELRIINIALRRKMSALAESDGKPPAVSAMVLHYMYVKGGSVKQKDVEQEFGMRRSTASKLITKLESDGYITRKVTGNDGRSKTIYLTERGSAEQSAIDEKFVRLEKQVDNALTREEREMFFKLSHKIRKCLDGEAR